MEPEVSDARSQGTGWHALRCGCWGTLNAPVWLSAVGLVLAASFLGFLLSQVFPFPREHPSAFRPS